MFFFANSNIAISNIISLVFSITNFYFLFLVTKIVILLENY